MTTDAGNVKRGRWGCLKITCFGCLGVVVLCAVLLIFLGRSLLQWEPGHSAWEHLPPSTAIAIEGHGINLLMEHALKDPAIVSSLESLGDNLSRYGTALAKAENIEINEDLDLQGALRRMLEWQKSLGFLYPAFGPNILLLGLGGDTGQTPFFIFRPATWLRWAVDAAGDPETVTEFGENNDKLFYVSKDGWLIVSASQPLVREVLDHWHDDTLRFGSATKSSDPYALLGFRASGNGATDQGSDADLPMFADPFASNDGAAKEGEDRAFACRLLLNPTKDGWLAKGDFLPRADTFGKTEWSVEPEAGAFTALPSGHAIALSADPTPLSWTHFGNWLAETAERRQASPDSDQARGLLWTWLWDGWLMDASGSFLLFADPPAAPERDGVSPLPVLTLGWKLEDGLDARDAAETFGDALVPILEYLTAPGGNPWLQAMRDSVAFERTEDGNAPGGRVTMPPVLANSAQPVWAFPLGAVAPAGWLASDPAGLAAAGAADAWFASAGREDVRDANRVHGRWDVTDAFRASAMAVIEERLELLSAEKAPVKKTVLDIAHWADWALARYPTGNVSVEESREQSGRLLLRLWVPFGVQTRK